MALWHGFWCSQNGWTALLVAVENGHTNVAKCLVDHRANVNVTNEVQIRTLACFLSHMSDNVFSWWTFFCVADVEPAS